MKNDLNQEALIQHIQDCRTFLSEISGIENKIVHMNGPEQYVEALEHFTTVLALKQRAEELGFVNADRFMRDQSGHSHWIGDDAKFIQGKDGPPYIESKTPLSQTFNYKTHCRVPVRSIIKAAKRALKTLEATP